MKKILLMILLLLSSVQASQIKPEDLIENVEKFSLLNLRHPVENNENNCADKAEDKNISPQMIRFRLSANLKQPSHSGITHSKVKIKMKDKFNNQYKFRASKPEYDQRIELISLGYDSKVDEIMQQTSEGFSVSLKEENFPIILKCYLTELTVQGKIRLMDKIEISSQSFEKDKKLEAVRLNFHHKKPNICKNCYKVTPAYKYN